MVLTFDELAGRRKAVYDTSFLHELDRHLTPKDMSFDTFTNYMADKGGHIIDYGRDQYRGLWNDTIYGMQRTKDTAKDYVGDLGAEFGMKTIGGGAMGLVMAGIIGFIAYKLINK